MHKRQKPIRILSTTKKIKIVTKYLSCESVTGLTSQNKNKGTINENIGEEIYVAIQTGVIEANEPFLNFNAASNLRQIHKLFASDSDLSLLQLQFNEMVHRKSSVKLNGNIVEIIKILVKISRAKVYKKIPTTLSRIEAFIPPDVE